MPCKILICFLFGCLFISAKPEPKLLLKKKLPVFFQPTRGGDTLTFVAESIVLNGGFTKLGDESYATIMEDGKQRMFDFMRDPTNFQLKPGETIEKKMYQALGSTSSKAQSIEVIGHENNHLAIDSIGILFKMIPPYSNYSKPIRLMFPISQTDWNGNVDSLSIWLSKKLL
jgi:hypothetical protein